ncbi:YHYH protein [Pseudooceanicola sp.]|uniref:YHYH protein n=1 Tax=Pseudooceanicola sp. TaxID=1914328 RepID=UPI002625BC1E|nr:YHYH protein [Pseudooceanicola sp.]MDF1856167.1 YHYH protein [Pseudooceanicola sp.]
MTRIPLAIAFALLAIPAQAHDNQVSIKVSGDQRCITSNGTPNHDIGQFPNSGDPNSFRAQTISVCVDATPTKTGRVTQHRGSVGISLTGIFFRPGTADYYDASSPRGHSRSPASGWNLEGMGAAETLGMDAQNAHVDERGLYHYHGVSSALANSLSGTQIGYAADGFPIHYAGSRAQSSWRLKSGTRPTAPGGRYDGTYEEDWTFVSGSGNLDQCNGATVDGEYVYFATDTYPFYPRCFLGSVSSDFGRKR